MSALLETCRCCNDSAVKPPSIEVSFVVSSCIASGELDGGYSKLSTIGSELTLFPSACNETCPVPTGETECERLCYWAYKFNEIQNEAFKNYSTETTIDGKSYCWSVGGDLVAENYCPAAYLGQETEYGEFEVIIPEYTCTNEIDFTQYDIVETSGCNFSLTWKSNPCTEDSINSSITCNPCLVAYNDFCGYWNGGICFGNVDLGLYNRSFPNQNYPYFVENKYDYTGSYEVTGSVLTIEQVDTAVTEIIATKDFSNLPNVGSGGETSAEVIVSAKNPLWTALNAGNSTLGSLKDAQNCGCLDSNSELYNSNLTEVTGISRSRKKAQVYIDRISATCYAKIWILRAKITTAPAVVDGGRFFSVTYPEEYTITPYEINFPDVGGGYCYKFPDEINYGLVPNDIIPIFELDGANIEAPFGGLSGAKQWLESNFQENGDGVLSQSVSWSSMDYIAIVKFSVVKNYEPPTYIKQNFILNDESPTPFQIYRPFDGYPPTTSEREAFDNWWNNGNPSGPPP